MVREFLSDVSEIVAPSVNHLEKRAFGFVTELFELLVAFDLGVGI